MNGRSRDPIHLGVDSPGLTVEQNVSNNKHLRRMLTDGDGGGSSAALRFLRIPSRERISEVRGSEQSIISKETTMGLYRTMVRIRTCEESFVDPILAKEIRCPVHLCTGQEAVAAGVCSALETEDYIFGNHRSHGHYLAKGGGMRELVAEVFCRETGCSRGRGGSMHLIDPSVGMMGSVPIVAGTIALAMGAALAAKIRNDRQGRRQLFRGWRHRRGGSLRIAEFRGVAEIADRLRLREQPLFHASSDR